MAGETKMIIITTKETTTDNDNNHMVNLALLAELSKIVRIQYRELFR